jgi:hypothetical protein
MKYHIQCNMQRNNVHYTAWIPEEKAHVGRVLKIIDEDGWVVTSVGTLKQPSKWINERSQDYKDFKERIK